MLIPVEHTKKRDGRFNCASPFGVLRQSIRRKETLPALAWFATPADSNLALRVTSLTEGRLNSLREERRGEFLSLLLWQLSKAHTCPATVLIDELDAAFL
jgi:hypothetical protein